MLALAWGLMPVFGQNTIGLPLIKNYLKTDYHGGSQTWGIDQDSLGRMYFANNEGLISFDGTYWKNFPLPNLTIARSVKIGAGGRIYVGGQGEAGYFSPNHFGTLDYQSIVGLVPASSREFADLWNIEIVGEAVFFRGSDRILEYSNQSVQVYPAPTEWMFMEKIGEHLFAKDKQRGLFTWNKQAWVPVENGTLSNRDAFHGGIILAPDSIVLVSYHNRNFLFTGNRLSAWKQITPDVVSEVVTIKPLNAQEYLMGTTGEGCIVFNKTGKLVQRITREEGLQDNSVLCANIDRFGDFWAGLNNGISLVTYNAPIKFIRPSQKAELSGYSARVFENKLFIATNDGAYSLPLNGAPADLGFCKGEFSRVPLSNGLSYRLDEINGHLMMGHNDGTFHLQNNLAEKLSADASWLYLPLSKVVPAKRTLVGNYTGIKWLNFASGNFSATSNLAGLKESFRFLAIDNEQQIWSSHPYRGIFGIDLGPDSMSYTTRVFTEKDGLPGTLDNHVFGVKSKVVFATTAGVYEFNRAKKRFVPSPFFTPMFGTTPVRYLKEDEVGNIWFVSGKKIGYLALHPDGKQPFSITYFPEITGQVLSGFENIYPYNQENVFVASEKGIILINLKKYLQARAQKKIILSSVHATGANDSLIHNGFFSDATGKASNSASPIHLPYSLNSLHFEYSCPAYGFQENIEYCFVLEGYEKEWGKWGNKPEKDYTNLPNGNYVFRVKGRSNLGIETDIASFAFSIAPPWYKSGWAFTGYMLLFAMGVYLLARYHRRKLERQKIQYEEKQEQLRVLHQLEIEKNEKEIIRLQNEKLASEVSFKNRELADTSMHLIERSDALQKVREILQKLHKGDPGHAEIKRAVHLLNETERNNNDWDKFSASFNEINNGFLRKLKTQYPMLTNNDLKLCAYLQLNMSTKDMAQLLNISVRGVEISRYRLRKKLGVPAAMNITDFLMGILNGPEGET